MKRRALLGLACVGLLGCPVGPDFARPAPPGVNRYGAEPRPGPTLSADGRQQRFAVGQAVPTDWWRLFGSPRLDTMMGEALTNNANLQAAQASLRRSEQLLRAGWGVFFPQIDGSAQAARQRFSGARFSFPVSSTFNLFTLQSTVSYTFDPWGGDLRKLEDLQAQVEQQRYLLAGAYLTLTGNLVNTMVARAAYREQVEDTEALVALETEQVQVTQAQAQAGTAPYVNVLTLQSQLAALQATLPPLRQKLDQADHLLATLSGRAPAEWRPPPLALADLTLPQELPLRLPSELVQQRPDIRQAEALLHQSSAEIGVATANLFPSVTLSGDAGLNATTLGTLFNAQSGFWSFGAGLAAPLFHGGTLWFQRKAALEAYDQALANYRQTVLSALGQVADALQALAHDAELVKAQSEQLAASKEALDLVQANFQAGTVNYLQVLVANAQYHQALVGHLEAQAQRLQDTAALLVALGGGPWPGEPGADGGSAGR